MAHCTLDGGEWSVPKTLSKRLIEKHMSSFAYGSTFFNHSKVPCTNEVVFVLHLKAFHIVHHSSERCYTADGDRI